MMKVDRKINFFDCDPAGIIFYSRVFELCHSAYEEMIEKFSLEENYWNNPDYVVPIIHAECDYLYPIKYGDEIQIILKVSNLRNSSFELLYEIILREKKCASLKTVHVFVSKKDWQKISIPEHLRQALNKHLNE
jgi:YbgC/YbaW family acyl-CoA thioester hydrolase